MASRTTVRIRRSAASRPPFVPWGLIPVLGWVVVALFGVSAFASRWIEATTDQCAQDILDLQGADWARASTDGQWVHLQGTAPSREEAARLVEAVRRQTAATWLGSWVPAVWVPEDFWQIAEWSEAGRDLRRQQARSLQGPDRARRLDRAGEAARGPAHLGPAAGVRVSGRVVVDHQGVEGRATRWRTAAAMGLTLVGSGRVLARAAVGRASAAAFDRRLARWSRRMFDVSRTTLRVVGDEGLGEAAVLLSHHASLLDIPAVLQTFPGRVTFVAKQELRSVPLFGAAMARYGIVFVQRDQRDRAIRQLESAKDALRDGTSVWIAAAGGRSRDGTLGPLKKGPFHLAMQLGVPLIPTWIHGTLDVIEPGSLTCVSGRTVEVRYGTPIPTAGASRSDLDDLMQRARAALLDLA